MLRMKTKYYFTIFVLFLMMKMTISLNSATIQWKSYKMKYEKQFDNYTAEIARMQIFSKNLQQIRKHNKLFFAGKVSYKKGVNQFTDMLDEEIAKITRSYIPDRHLRQSKSKLIQTFSHALVGNSRQSVPKEKDWRKSSLLTSVKNQKNCGACWAFSAAGALEGLFAKNNKSKESISVQNFLDCSNEYGNHGCKGGNMNRAFQYVYDNGGIDLDSKYKYEGEDKVRCRYDPAESPGFVTKVKLISEDEYSVKCSVAADGPVSAAMDATNLHHYEKGIYSDDDCDPENINHAVLIVGYGTDKRTGKDFWVIKNSWGEEWGEKGYFRLLRNDGDHCGIASDASVPIKTN